MVGSIHVAILPSGQCMKIFYYNSTCMNASEPPAIVDQPNLKKCSRKHFEGILC